MCRPDSSICKVRRLFMRRPALFAGTHCELGRFPHVSMKKMCPDVSASRSDHGATLLHALHHTFSSKPVQRAIGWHQRLQ